MTNSDGSITNPDGSVTYPAHTVPAPTPARNPDGSITNPDGSVTYPAGSKQASREGTPANAPANAQPAYAHPTQAPPPEAPRRVTIPSGASVVIRTTETLSASRNNIGDRFTGVLDRPLVDAAGQIVVPSGTQVAGEVVAAKGKGRFAGAGDIGIELTSIGNGRVSTSEYEAVGKGRGKRTAAFVGGGAGLGALIGGLAGGGKGALIGMNGDAIHGNACLLGEFANPIRDAIALMETGRFRNVPIVDGDGFVQGIVRPQDVMRYLAEAFPEEVLNLPPRPHQQMMESEGA